MAHAGRSRNRRAGWRNPASGEGVVHHVLVEVWSDVVCPWCYLGATRLERALEAFEHADEVEVRWRSFELDPRAPVRRASPMPVQVAAKYGLTVEAATARLEAMDRLAALEGLVTDLAHTVGGNTLDAHRLLQLASSTTPSLATALHGALMAAHFAERRAIGDRDVLAEVAAQVGLDDDEVADVLSSDRFSDAVRGDEDEAAALDCTGVPFFVIDRSVAIAGAQEPALLVRVLRRAWDRTERPPSVPSTVAGAGDLAVGACET